ncbi:MAG TPA: type 4a pilus biogenesis protein PilO [Casimicrobium huifangae]|jgi:type IV pilus assembly protein PilO|uniref:type 4a pilus biogenesis protein PilO n=1 Tax=Casimicrobium huifangae TaxID=2591109 RepID=UPI0012EBB5F0|nr:type 4a pilus biogenesis protein PilO [Casimicrobium huifangae]HOB00640.1 type 4a pilus biogenesis protein PilO [Casimicrobium huifangae]HQA32943.1 type 4a pilus biogenesis protein PilO [Casimicrobium huifangae]HQD64578.1 type 4a pilus biogenesis protein PilO [Casimicrobium huifangae]
MTLDEIRRLNPRDIGVWPLPAKIAAVLLLILVLLGAAAYFGWMPQYEELEGKQNQEQTLRQEYTAKKAQAINLDLHIQQLKEVEQQFGALLRQLPSKSEMDALLSDINQAGLGRGLQFELFKPSQERLQDFYAELPVDVRVTGNYHDIGAFASDVSQLSRIVTLNDIAITNKDPKDMVLTMEAVAKTFRYLDDEEVAAQRKAKDAQKAPKK